MWTQSPAASPRPPHRVSLLVGQRLPAPLLDVKGWCFLSTDGGGRRPPYAPPQRTRSATSAIPPDRLHCGHGLPIFIHLLCPFLIFYPVRPGGVQENTESGGGGYPICSPIEPPPPPLRPPLGLLPEPRRARVKGVTNTHHEEVGGLPVFSPDFAFAKLAIRGRYRCVI